MKRKIFRWISVNLLGKKEGDEHAKWLLSLFYPIRYIALTQSNIGYDFVSGVYTIEGIRFDESFFRDFAKGLPEGCYFKFLKREDGQVYIQRIEQP